MGSRFLHDDVKIGDVLKVTPPAGDFFLAEQPARPVVLLSGGVGLTPMVSMVEHIAARHPALEAHFVHGALNSGAHAMDQHVRDLAKAHGGVSVTTFYSEPLDGDQAGQTHDVDGFVTVDWLAANTPLASRRTSICADPSRSCGRSSAALRRPACRPTASTTSSSDRPKTCWRPRRSG
jgi:nitric oxide dioxygenase